MPNSEEVEAMLEHARNDGELSFAIVIGKSDDGGLRIFTPTADKEEINSLIERVKQQVNK